MAWNESSLKSQDAFQQYRGHPAVVGQPIVWWGAGWRPKKKGRRHKPCSRRPRQGTQQNRTWPTPPSGGVATSSASAEYKSRRPAQVGGFVWKQILTLTRLQVVKGQKFC